MVYGWIFERFEADFMPLMILASMIGMISIWGHLERTRRNARVLALTVVCLMALFGFVTNLGSAVTPTTNWTQPQVEHFVETEQAFSDVTGHPLSHDVVKGSNYPLSASTGELFVQGNCDDLYIYEASMWMRVERAPETLLCRSLISTAAIVPFFTYLVTPSRQRTRIQHRRATRC